MRYLNIERALPAWAVQYLGLGWNAEKRAITIPVEGETKFRSLLAYDPVTGAIESGPNKMW